MQQASFAVTWSGDPSHRRLVLSLALPQDFLGSVMWFGLDLRRAVGRPPDARELQEILVLLGAAAPVTSSSAMVPLAIHHVAGLQRVAWSVEDTQDVMAVVPSYQRSLWGGAFEGREEEEEGD